MTLVVILKFHVAPGREAEFESMVSQRAQLHRRDPGFERMYLLRPDAGEYRLVSWWRRLDEPASWVRTEAYAMSEDAAHAGVVQGPVVHEVLEIVQQF